MKTQSIIVALQLAFAAAAGADTISAGVLRSNEDATVTETVDAVPADADDSLGWGRNLMNRGRYQMRYRGKFSEWAGYRDSPTLYMTVAESEDGDKRDGSSSYVFVDSTMDKDHAVFVALRTDPKRPELFKLQYNPPHRGTPRYLAVHDSVSGDKTDEGEFRLIAHEDPDRAVILYLRRERSDIYTLGVHRNLDNYRRAAGFKIGVPQSGAERTDGSMYLGVVKNYDDNALFEYRQV